MKLFDNGTETASIEASWQRRTNKLPLFIGAAPDNASQPTRCFHGLIDGVRLSAAAVYAQKFDPAKTFKITASAKLLMHLDKHVGPFLFDRSQQEAVLTMAPEATLVPVHR